MHIKTESIRVIAALLAMIMAISMFGACKLTEDEPSPAEETSAPNDPPISMVTETPEPTDVPVGTPWPENLEYDGTSVVMRCGDTEITMYDYGQAFYSSQYLQYYMYGMMTTEQYYNMVLDELSTLVYLVNEAKANGVELTEDEIVEVDTVIDQHLEQVLKSYAESIEEEGVDKDAEGRKQFEADLAEDGLTYDSFIRLAKNNLRLHRQAEKYYNTLIEQVKVSDDEVRKYVDDNSAAAAEYTVPDFVDAMNAYFEGNGAYPVYIVDDCFSVNHIYLAFETKVTSDNDIEYLTDSRKDDEAAVEAKLPELADFDAFMEYEKEIGEDPGMDEGSPYLENGYIIHPDMLDSYFEGFVYAAMNLHEGIWSPPPKEGEGSVTMPNLSYFELKDGEKVVKVCTESGVHYIIVNKEFKKGPVEYEIGDEIWESWRTAASESNAEELYERLIEEWKGKYVIDIDRATIKAKYAPEETDAPTGDDADNG